MGTDIHSIVEQKNDGAWVAVNTLTRLYSNDHGTVTSAANARNRDRFTKLAGIYGAGPAPRGLPDDASDTTRTLAAQQAGQIHSHSWLTLADAVQIWLSTETHTAPANNWFASIPYQRFFGVCPNDQPGFGVDDFRVVFWFEV